MGNLKKYTFYINGLHCKACVILNEEKIGGLPAVTNAIVSYKQGTVEVEGDFGELSAEQIVQLLNKTVKDDGYSVTTTPINHRNHWSVFKIALPLAVLFIFLFITLQKIGLVKIISSGEMNYSTAFIVGIVASLSTCMAVVGGLILSMSANYAKAGNNTKPQLLFHLARLVAFFILGGVIGLIGSTFKLTITSTFILNFVVGIIILILGLNLLDIFPKIKNLLPTLPASTSKLITNLKNSNTFVTPILVGAATFFLPCGFTQSMQLYTLTTGNFFTGGLTMLAFALGTLPILGLLSFSSAAIIKPQYTELFFKTAGLVVIFFGLLNILNSLVAIGFIQPLFSL